MSAAGSGDGVCAEGRRNGNTRLHFIPFPCLPTTSTADTGWESPVAFAFSTKTSLITQYSPMFQGMARIQRYSLYLEHTFFATYKAITNHFAIRGQKCFWLNPKDLTEELHLRQHIRCKAKTGSFSTVHEPKHPPRTLPIRALRSWYAVRAFTNQAASDSRSERMQERTICCPSPAISRACSMCCVQFVPFWTEAAWFHSPTLFFLFSITD